MSRLCLSCHDGTVAIDSFNGNTGSMMIAGNALLGTNLSDDHPLGMEWRHQTQMPACAHCHSAHGSMANPGPVYFFNRRVECPSCHDVHDKDTIPNLLVMTNTASQLCLHCHGK
ncbi:MAG: hypothetical protein JRH20_23840 [Deltaproteobacteria bacterium]|nr:hypothetical protein [Deltaproteobacteria bacterium]